MAQVEIVVWVRSLARELPHATDVAKKKKMVIKHHYIEKGMWNYVYLDNKKFFPKSRVNCIKMVIVVVLGWWEDGYVLYFLNLL